MVPGPPRPPGRRRLAVLVVAGGIAAAVVATSGPVPHVRSGTGTTLRGTPSTNAPTTTPSSTGTPSTGTPATNAPARTPPHVMVIVMENHGYSQILGNPTAPDLSSLAARYGLATASYAKTHPSLPNYLDLVSGSVQGITSDCTTCTADAPQLVDPLQHAGISWKAYMEAAPSACFTGTAPPFDRHHDPFVYAPHITADRAECDHVVPFTTFGSALANGALPSFVWVTPYVLHDMHTGTVAAGDAWIRETLTQLLASQWFRDEGVVIVTFDEGTGGTDARCCTGSAGGHILTVVVSPRTPPRARMSTPVDDAGVLRTIEALYHLPYLGAAADPTSGTLLPLLGSSRARG